MSIRLKRCLLIEHRYCVNLTTPRYTAVFVHTLEAGSTVTLKPLALLAISQQALDLAKQKTLRGADTFWRRFKTCRKLIEDG